MKILLAIDDSKFAEAATQSLIERIRPEDVEVRVITVVDLINYFTTDEAAKVYIPRIEELRRDRLKKAEELTDRALHKLQPAGFNAKCVVSEGDPKTKIVAFAEEWGADLIVLGSHGRKGFDRALLGSVSEGVARYARCSVAIVRIRPGK